jgi:hypothetical protein
VIEHRIGLHVAMQRLGILETYISNAPSRRPRPGEPGGSPSRRRSSRPIACQPRTGRACPRRAEGADTRKDRAERCAHGDKWTPPGGSPQVAAQALPPERSTRACSRRPRRQPANRITPKIGMQHRSLRPERREPLRPSPEPRIDGRDGAVPRAGGPCRARCLLPAPHSPLSGQTAQRPGAG